MKRCLSLFTAIILVLSMVPAFTVFAAEPVTVYVDPQNGSNENSGTEAAPVQDLEAAYALLQEAGGTVVMLGTVNYTAVKTLPACAHPVTITSKTGAEGISSNSHIVMAGETTFKNISLTLTKASTGTTICGGGHKLTMDEGVTIVPFVNSEGTYYFCLAGGYYNNGIADSTDLTVKSGQYRYVYAAGYTTGANGDVKLTMTGGTTANLAVLRTGTVTGDVEMHFSGTARVTGAIYAGGATTGTLKKSCTITLGQGASFKNLYAGSNGSGSIAGAVTVICDGFDGTFTNFKGKGGSSCTGTVGSSRLVLKSGTVQKAPTDFGTVDIEIPENKTLTLACSLTADTMTCAGTLNFSGAASLTAGAVTGGVNCTVDGEVLENHTYVTAPSGSAISFPEDSGITEQNGKWCNQDLTNFAGLVVKSKSTVKLNLYTGIWARGDESAYTLVAPYVTETVDGYTYRYYPNAQGSYHVRASQSGYITLYKNIYMSEEEAATKTAETITLDKKGENGFVPSVMYSHTDEVLESAWKSDKSMFPKYEGALLNPVFQEGRDPQQQTTNEELEACIAALDGETDDMYVFSLGRTDRFDYNIPAVIFTKTDLSSAKDLEEAAAILGNSRLNVLYRAQIHGNEPAGGEGALAMMYYLQQGYSEDILDNMNLIIVPRLSPDSAQLYQRPLYNSSHTCDQLLQQSGEVQALIRAYLLFDPEVVFDGHERVWNNNSGDIQVSTSFTPMNSDAFRTTALEMDDAAFKELEANDLCGFYYSVALNGNDTNMANAYFATAGSLYVLMETRGIYGGNEAMERRVVAHMAAVTGLLDYLHENASEVKSMIAAERAAIVRNGATYESDDIFVLQTTSRTTTAADKEAWGLLKTDRQMVDWATGAVTFPTRYPTVYDVVARSRVAPTAYVIPADLESIEDILTLMDRHGITYTYLPQGATLPLQRYGGTTTEATLSAETLTRFASGCYVFTMNQERALVLGSLMEPDNTNASSYSGTAAQRGYLNVTDTYRYVRDLNENGTVDYTVTAAELTAVTVYLDGTNGADTNDGLTEGTAVKTLEKAYSIMEAALSSAEEGSYGNLIIAGMYDLGAKQSKLPVASYPVVITGKTASDGFTFTGGSTQATRTFELQGDTTFHHMTIHINNTQAFNFFLANGHKLVIGEGMNMTTKGTHHFTLAGGSYDYAQAVASTDITVRSGAWRTIYAGGYRGSVTGRAKADISGARVFNNIAPTYCGNIGTLEMTVRDTDISVVSSVAAYSNIYAGPVEYVDTKDQGAVLGDATVILGKNVTGNGAYASSCLEGSIHGTATIVADGVDLSQFPVCATSPRRTAGTTAAAVLKLGADVTQDVTLDAALPLDLNGFDITGNLTVDGTLTVKDSATDDYDVSDGICGEITGTVTGTLQAAEGYLAAGGGFHKFSQRISHINLRPTDAGIYYSATFLGDEVLMNEIETGIAVSLTDLPGADFATDADTLYTTGTNSVVIQDILKGDANDADRAIADIYAASYVKLKDGTVLTSNENIAYSLYDILHLVKEQYPDDFADFVKTHNIESWF